jgi:hypothetical protein
MRNPSCRTLQRFSRSASLLVLAPPIVATDQSVGECLPAPVGANFVLFGRPVSQQERTLATAGDRMDVPPVDGDWVDRPVVLASLSRYRGIVIAATVLAALLCYGLASLQPVQYKAEAMLILRNPGAPSLVAGSNGPTADAERGRNRQAGRHRHLVAGADPRAADRPQ